MHSRDDFHQRGFSGSVLSHQRMYRAGAQNKIYTMQDFHSIKTFMNILEFDQIHCFATSLCF